MGSRGVRVKGQGKLWGQKKRPETANIDSHRIFASRANDSVHAYFVCCINPQIDCHQRQPAWRCFVAKSPDIEALTRIRHCTNTDLMLGTGTFKEEVRNL